MNRLKLTFAFMALATMCCFSTFSARRSMYVYRNDGGFHRIADPDNLRFYHNLAEGKVTISGPDSILEVPLGVLDSCVIARDRMPEMYLTFTEYPDSTSLWQKDLYLDTHLYTEDPEGDTYHYDLELKVKGRGNSTWSFPKKPMRLKFGKKTSLLGFAKAKNYVLLANYIDESLAKNEIAHWIARRIGLPFSNHTLSCNVYVNGSYRGVYTLTEKVGINSASVDIDENTGVLLELSTEYDEKYKFRDACYDLPVMVKDPDFDDLFEECDTISPEDRLELWRKDFDTAVKLTRDSLNFRYFDLPTFARFFFLNNIVLNNETGFPKSVYIYKEGSGTDERYKFGPGWDFDVAFNYRTANGQGGFAEIAPDTHLWKNRLFGLLVGCEGFIEEYGKILDEFERAGWPELQSYIEDLAGRLDKGGRLDAQVWPFEGKISSWVMRKSALDARENTLRIGYWLEERLKFMRKQFDNKTF